MSDRLHVVTGATGLLGSHIIEELVRRGHRVRALVRPSSDTALLAGLGADVVAVDYANGDALRSAVASADVVYHCAARVSDWGSWSMFKEHVILPTQQMLDACRTAGIGRFLLVSSSRVYGHPRHSDRHITEVEPLGQRLWRLWDYYPQAKIETERMCRAFPGNWTIVRPTWIYGVRDRNTLPRIIRTLQLGQAALIGSGDNPLNIVCASDAAEGVVLAAYSPKALGQTYNLGASDKFTQREFLDALAEGLGQPPLQRHVPYWLAFRAGFLVELVGKALRVKRSLRVTRHGVSLLGSALEISSAKAGEELGWVPKVMPRDGLRHTVEWYFRQGEKI